MKSIAPLPWFERCGPRRRWTAPRGTWLAGWMAAVLLLSAAGWPASPAEEASWTIRGVFDPLDHAHEYLSEQVYRFAYWADEVVGGVSGHALDPEERRARFFADRRIVDNTRSSYVRVAPVLRLSESGVVELDADFSAHLRLPRAQERARLVLDRSDWQTSLVRDFEGASGAETFEREKTEGSAGVDVGLFEAARLRFTGRAGMSFRPEPEPRLQVGVHGRYPLGEDWFLLPRQVVFWDAGEGFGEKTSVDVEKFLTPRLRLRPGVEVIWSETSRGVDLSQYASLFYFLSDRRMIGVKAGVFEHTRPSAVVDEYRVRFPYRQRVWKEWMFVRVEPGARFLREEGYGFQPEVIIAIDLFAGRVPQ